MVTSYTLISTVHQGAVALHINGIGKDLYLGEYIGGRINGTKINSVLKGRVIKAAVSDVDIHYTFSRDFNEVH